MAKKAYIEHSVFLKKLRYISKTYGLSNVIIEKLKMAMAHSINADVEPVTHGRWVKTTRAAAAPNGLYYWGKAETVFVCSECGRAEDKEEPYCNCGAKMDLSKVKEREG